MKKTRRSSARALQNIRQLAELSKFSDGEGSDENVRHCDSNEDCSEGSDSNFKASSESNSSQTDSESDEASSENEQATPETDSSEDAIGPLSKKFSQQTSIRSSNVRKVLSTSVSSLSAISSQKSQKSSTTSPFFSYISVSKRRQFKSIRQMAIDYFERAISTMRYNYFHLTHPFCIITDLSHKDQCSARRSILFPTAFYWIPCPTNEIKNHLPLPYFSPLITGCGSNQGTTVGSNLLYVGGCVKSIAWCPPRTCLQQKDVGEMKEPMFLAVATYPSPGTRVLYSDAAKSSPGVIQIWNCGMLGLMHHQVDWQPEPHLFVSHSWGHVMDMCWVPLSPNLAARTTKPDSQCHPQQQQRQPPLLPDSSTAPLINRIMGHLIVACQDGYVRIFAPLLFQLDPIFFHTYRPCPLYEINPSGVLILSPCATKHPDWLGWPTTLHIRTEYPDRLFVGYSRGHVAYYDLQCLEPSLFNAAKSHLSPVWLFRLLVGPVQSMSLNPRNGRMLVVQGLDTLHRVWDIEDTVSLNTSNSSEFHWPLLHGIPGRQVLWHSRGDMIYCSREAYFPINLFANDGKSKSYELSDAINRCENSVVGTTIEAPSEACRYFAHLGVQSVSHMDFSDPLNTLAYTTDRGRVELLIDTLDGRVKMSHKMRYLEQIRLPLLQWSMDVFSPNEKTQEAETEEDMLKRLLDSECYLIPNSAASINPSVVENNFLDPACADCITPSAFCWHKLWTQYKLTVNTKTKVPKTPYADFLKTPMLNATQVQFCPHIQAATWVAVGTAFGFVQFVCIDALYLTDFDRLMNLTPAKTSMDSMCLKVDRPPATQSLHMPSPWSCPRPTKERKTVTKLPKRERQKTRDVDTPRSIVGKQRLPVRTNRKRQVNGRFEESSSSIDSDVTEAMTVSRVDQEEEDVKYFTGIADGDDTDPCLE